MKFVKFVDKSGSPRPSVSQIPFVKFVKFVDKSGSLRPSDSQIPFAEIVESFVFIHELYELNELDESLLSASSCFFLDFVESAFFIH